MIAMALSCNPQLLIADEPTTALDVTVQKTIIELLRKLKNDRGMSMIFISHDLGLVSEISDKVVVMYKGQIMEQGNAEQVFSNPHHPYTKGLLACRPSANLNLKKLPTVTDFMQVQEDGSIKETSLDLDKVNQQFGFKVGEKEKRLSEIYSREPLLKLNSVKTWFPIKKGFLVRRRNM